MLVEKMGKKQIVSTSVIEQLRKDIGFLSELLRKGGISTLPLCRTLLFVE